MILLTATSTVQDAVERACLIATGIPSLLPCRASGLTLCGESWTVLLNQPNGRSRLKRLSPTRHWISSIPRHTMAAR